MGVLLNCFVSPCAPGGFWIATDFSVFSVMFLSDDCSSRFQGERIKLTEAFSLLSAGYVFSSQVMYGIQEAAAACLLVACVGLLVLFVGWQPQPAACMMIGMLALSRVRKFMKLRVSRFSPVTRLRVSGNRRQDGWTSPARSRSLRQLQQQQQQQVAHR